MSRNQPSIRRSLSTAFASLGVVLVLGCQEKGGPAPRPSSEVVTTGSSPVAELIGMESEVSARRASEIVWKGASVGARFEHKDAVRTGSDSSGVLRFSDGTLLKMGASTLVIVVEKSRRANVERTVISLPAGKVDGRLPAGGEREVELVLKTARGWIRARSAGKGKPAPAFRAVLSPKGAIQVTTGGGELELVTAKGSARLGANQAVSLPEVPGAIPVDLDKFDVSQAAIEAAGEAATSVPGVPSVIGEADLSQAKAIVAPAESVRAIQMEIASAEQANAALPAVARDGAKAPEAPPERAPERSVVSRAEEAPAPAAPVSAPAASPAPKAARPVLRVMDVFRVDSPKNRVTVAAGKVVVKGELSGRMKAFLNGKAVVAGANGRFEFEVPLNPGTNILTFQVIGPSAKDLKYETVEVIRR